MKNTIIKKCTIAGAVLCGLLAGKPASAQQVEEKRDTLRASRVTAEKRERDDAATQTGLQRIDASKINRGFALFNSPDIIKTLQTLPGVAAGTELMSGIYVHGGDGTDNLFMLDGVPIYQVSHLIGMFSSFNSDVVESLDFYKSGFPARYGGKMSSVVDVRTKSGDFEDYHGLFAIGLIDGRLHLEGPIVKGKTSFNIGLRRTWMDMVTTPIIWYANWHAIKEDGKDKANQVNGGYNFSDFNAGITHKFSEDNILKLNFYAGQDKADFGLKEPESDDDGDTIHWGYDNVHAKVTWGNLLASLNWQYDISDMLYLDATAYHSRNHSLIDLGMDEWQWRDGKDAYNTISENVASHVNVTGVKTNLHIRPNEHHHIRTGLMAQHNLYLPSRAFSLDFKMGNIPLQMSNSVDSEYKGMESALYVEDEMGITPWLKANIGARGVLFAVKGKNWMKLEPRASLKFQCGTNTSIRMSYTEMNQYDHSIATSYLDLPTNTWMPSTSIIKPMFSRQFAGGVYSTLPNHFKLTLEGWYKTMEHMYEYNGITTLYPPIDSWENDFIEGKGKSWGLEYGLEYEGEKLSAQVYYTLSWSMRKFEDFYFDWYPDRNDNRHKFDIMLNYCPKPRFELFAGWHYHTGNNITAATYSLHNNDGKYYIYDIYDKPNSLKLPDYHRLDVGLNWHRIKKNGHEAIWNLSIYNTYCRMNAITGQIDMETEETVDKDGFTMYVPTGRYKGTAIGIIPIIPTLGYTLKF